MQTKGRNEARPLRVHHLDRLAACAEGALAVQRLDGAVCLIRCGVGDKGVALVDVQLVRNHTPVRPKEVQQVVREKLAERELADKQLRHRSVYFLSAYCTMCSAVLA